MPHRLIIFLFTIHFAQAGLTQSQPSDYEIMDNLYPIKIANKEILKDRLTATKFFEKIKYEEKIKKNLEKRFLQLADRTFQAEEIPTQVKILFDLCIWKKIKKTIATEHFENLYKNFLTEIRPIRRQLIELLLLDHPEALKELEAKKLITVIPSVVV